ncbi:hypothetical protein B0T14DRAFT_604888 [Immersiella caudata]|uniref:Uncharacterized protein n=1 Tax=Immersiella caudata TaxID=314043 RepID=A0AA39WJR3_9PEZI|nr:hypothetical protein B0T14DRAFT_604888 [Immersiella caudata]
MRTTPSFFALAALSQITAALPSPAQQVAAPALFANSAVPVEARAVAALTHIYICKDINWVNCSNQEVQTGVCYGTNSDWNDKISSAGPDRGTTCVLYQNANCGGSSLTISNPGIADLRGVNFNDKTSSIRCS